jgi:hypothetical protein
MGWEHREGASIVIHVSVSDDGAATWSTPVTVADEGRGAFMPAIAVAGDVIRLSYTSMDTAGYYETRYRESADGASWSAPTVLSQGEACQCWSPLTSTYVHGQGLGHYHGLDARAGRIISTWADNRDVTGYQTIYARTGALG